MDIKRQVLDFMKANRGTKFTPEEIAITLNQEEGRRFQKDGEVELQVNPQEVLDCCLELREEEERFAHYTSSQAEGVLIDGEHRALYLSEDYLKYDVVAEHAPERLEEVDHMYAEELRDWIVDELADEGGEVSQIEHEFEWEEVGWGSSE